MGEIPIFGRFLAKKNQFWPIFRWKSTFSGWPCFITSLWRHTLTDFHDVGINKKRSPYPILWYQTNYTSGLSISNSQGVLTTPLRKTCYKKRLRKTRVNHLKVNKSASEVYKTILFLNLCVNTNNLRCILLKSEQF